ncbi:MAG: DUF4197 domain-containing protein [Rhodovibrionaceae bacterium]|nr:DUF4197 domain-containing protein [Rhodovibrionaceae bacterium]
MSRTTNRPARWTRRGLLKSGAVGAIGGLWLSSGASPVRAANLWDSAKELLEGATGSGGLSEGEIARGLREALRVGTERVVEQVGEFDGFNLDPKIHIPLPGALSDVQDALKPLGLSGMADDLELRLNRAAERAAPEAQALFFDAISQMTLEDARKILDGPDDAATQYFRRTMSPRLSKRMRPIVSDTLAETGAYRAYDDMMGEYKTLPLVPDVQADITDYTVEKALDGIFYYVAKEEAAIRNNPAKRTTELLQKVFGSG